VRFSDYQYLLEIYNLELMREYLQYLDEIHKTESIFSEIISRHLKDVGVNMRKNASFELLLDKAMTFLPYQEQFIQPIMKWNRKKAECYQLAEQKRTHEEETIEKMIEKTANDGKVLLLTFSQKV
jgi:hypothetical protein